MEIKQTSTIHLTKKELMEAVESYLPRLGLKKTGIKVINWNLDAFSTQPHVFTYESIDSPTPQT